MGLHGVVMHCTCFEPQTGACDVVHATGFSPTRTLTVPSTETGQVPRHMPPIFRSCAVYVPFFSYVCLYSAGILQVPAIELSSVSHCTHCRSLPSPKSIRVS